MSRRSILLGTMAAITLLAVAALIVLAPENTAPFPVAPSIEEAEHARTIDALRPPKRQRPVTAIVTLNDATEVTDLLVPYAVLSHANVADVTVVAERAEPVRLHPFQRPRATASPSWRCRVRRRWTGTAIGSGTSRPAGFSAARRPHTIVAVC